MPALREKYYGNGIINMTADINSSNNNGSSDNADNIVEDLMKLIDIEQVK